MNEPAKSSSGVVGNKAARKAGASKKQLDAQVDS
jgi:hypothetical protein